VNAALLFFIAAQSMRPFPSMSESMRPYASMSANAGGDVGGPAVRIDAMPFARTVTCSDYTLTGTAPGAGAVSWAASPSGASGACTGTTSWSCVVDVAPDTAGEGVETITVSQSGATGGTVTIGFYVEGEHSCFLAQSYDGAYNAGKADLAAVATWVNLGSSALNVTQATGSAQPTYRTGIVGGQPVVRCDGGDRVAAATAADWNLLHNGSDVTTESLFYGSHPDPNARLFLMATTTAVAGAPVGYILQIDDRVAGPFDDRVFAFMGNGGAFAVSLTSATDNNAPAQMFNLAQMTLNDTAGVDAFLYANGSQIASASGASYSVADATGPLTLCAGTGGASPFTGDMFRNMIYPVELTTTQLDINRAVDQWALGGTLPVLALAPTSTDVWMFTGDSITAGSLGVTPWPTNLQDYAPIITFENRALSGALATGIVTQFTGPTPPYPTKVFVLGGVNSIAVDVTGAAVHTSLSSIYSEASANGTQVIAVITPPFGAAASWTPGRQVEMEDLTARIKADPNVDVVVDLYAMMGDPVDPDNMDPALRIDSVHPNETGSQFMADAVATALGL
jgi:lysophospholipase L1-like esterase